MQEGVLITTRRSLPLPRIATLLGVATAALLGLSTPASAGPTLRGELREVVSDDFREGRAGSAWYVVSADGEAEPFRPTVGVSTLRRAAGSEVAVATSGSGALPQGTLVDVGPRAADAEPPVRTVAVVPVRTDLAGEPPTPAALAARWEGLPDYWRQQSFGRQAARVDYLEPVTVAGTPPCGVAGLDTDVRAAAAADGRSVSAYDHVVAVPERNGACGSLGGQAWTPGRDVFVNGSQDLSVVVHEIGHNLRMRHANVLRCTKDGETVAVGGTCVSEEYADPFDVMGNRSIGLFQAANRSLAGVYADDPGARRHVSASGTYTVDSVNTPGGEDFVTIDRPGEATDLAVEVRTPASPFDAFAPLDPVSQGVLLRLVAPGQSTQLLRAGLADSGTTFGDAASAAPLPAGGDFVDPGTGLRLHVDAVADGQATVTVAYDAPDTTPPTAPSLTLERTGDQVTARWTAAEDDRTVVGYAVEGLAFATVELGPDDRELTRPVTLDGRTIRVRVVAVDASGNRTPSAWVEEQLPDRTPPPAVFGFGQTFLGAGRHSVSWNLGGEPGATFDVTLDGAPLTSGSTNTNAEFVATRPGAHTVAVVAIDAAGNRGPVATYVVDVRPTDVAQVPATPVPPVDVVLPPPTGPAPIATTPPPVVVVPRPPVTVPRPATPARPAAGATGRPGSGASGTPAAGTATTLAVARGGARFTVAPWTTTSKRLSVRVARAGWRVTQLTVRRNGRRVALCRSRSTCAVATPAAFRRGLRTLTVAARLERPAARGRAAVRRTTTVAFTVRDGRLVAR